MRVGPGCPPGRDGVMYAHHDSGVKGLPVSFSILRSTLIQATTGDMGQSTVVKGHLVELLFCCHFFVAPLTIVARLWCISSPVEASISSWPR